MPQNYVKLIVTNNVIELMEYEKLNVKNKIPDTAYIIEKGQGLHKDENYARKMQHRRDNVRRLITMNFDSTSKFVTLTFAENIKDVKLANHHYEKFIKRLKRRYPDLKYLTVVEFQDKKGRGAVHYHMICNLPFIKKTELFDIWGNGWVYINKIKHVDNIGAYVIKYMTKDSDDKRLQGLKAYNCSKGLERPTEITTWKDGTEIVKKVFDKLGLEKKEPVYLSQYTSENAGQIVYVQYNLTRPK